MSPRSRVPLRLGHRPAGDGVEDLPVVALKTA